MATGFNIMLPNGSVARTSSSSYDERVKICDDLLERWKGYCLNNWLSVNDHPYSPQNKVKMFLSSLGYFLISGGGGDEHRIVTRYKEVMNGKRQLPVSACPDYIEDTMYGLIHNGGSETEFARSQRQAFNDYVTLLDENATKRYKPRQHKRIKTQTISDRFLNVKKNGGREIIRCVVDTEGVFSIDGKKYEIDMEHCTQYAPKSVSHNETLFDMDCVMCARCDDGKMLFYDQRYYPIDAYVHQM